MGSPTRRSYEASRRILIYLLRTSDLGITYGGGRPSSLRLDTIWRPFDPMHDAACSAMHTISDANWETGRSCTGFVIMLNGAAVAWVAKKQPATALSSLDAETYAAAAATAETIWARGLMAELGYPQTGPTPLWGDNTGQTAVATDAASMGRSRHIARRANFLQDANQAHEVMSRHMPGEDTCADALTKPLDRKRFVRLREYMMGQYRKSGGPAAK